MNMLLMESAP